MILFSDDHIRIIWWCTRTPRCNDLRALLKSLQERWETVGMVVNGWNKGQS